MGDDEADRLRDACTRFLTGHGPANAATQLAALSDEIVVDTYGEGGVVAELEAEVADLLGMEAAAFFPSGTMAQQAALRIHADARGSRTVAWHPTCHIALHEEQAAERLHGLIGRPVGERTRLVALDDLLSLHEPVGTLVLELPQREIGGALPAWDDLMSQVGWAREAGTAVHLDGARLWQCPPAYGRSLGEIAELFDSVYVSFYKDLGGLPGSCLAGSSDFIAQARLWRRRHGGTLFGLWPLAASALAALRVRLPRMATYREHALAIADAVRAVEGLRLMPDPPHASMMHVLFRGEADVLRQRMLDIARDDGLWTWRRVWPTDHPDWQAVELTVGDATMALDAEEITGALVQITGH